MCGRGRGEGLQEVEVVSSVCGGTEELGDLEPMGSQRVGHDRVTNGDIDTSTLRTACCQEAEFPVLQP